jgi:hypothetical protein
MKSYLSVTYRYALVTSMLANIYFIVTSGGNSLVKKSIAKKILIFAK